MMGNSRSCVQTGRVSGVDINDGTICRAKSPIPGATCVAKVGNEGAAQSASGSPSTLFATHAPDRNKSNDFITVIQLSRLLPDANESYLGQVAVELNADLGLFGLNTALRKAHFFAQVMEEAGPGLQAQEENLNYKPEVLKSIFSYYKLHPDEADQDGYEIDPKNPKSKLITRKANCEQIADKAYGNRNGNTASGDGWKYRGRGLIQVTGRGNYAAINTEYGLLYAKIEVCCVDFVRNPELLKDFPYSVRSAVCFWVQNGLGRLADLGGTDANVDAITAVVNKRTKSYGDRCVNFKAAYSVFR